MLQENAWKGERELRERGYTAIDLDLLELVTRYAGTPIKWDIITFFAENPYSRDIATNIAGRIGRGEAVVHRELEDLVLLGFLQKSRLADDFFYHVLASADLWAVLERFTLAF